MSRPFSAMVLAAGLGTRLRPLSEEVPKPLLPIGDRPLLVTTLEQLRAAGAQSLSVNAHHLSHKIHPIIDSLRFDVHVLNEEKILGTAGGIRSAAASFSASTVVVVNGDMLGVLPIPQLLESARSDSVVLAVSPRPVGAGTVGLGVDGRLVRLRGECFGSEAAGADYLGVARLTESVWLRFPEEGCLVGDYLLPALRRGEPVGTVSVSEELTDVGDLAGYFAANLSWLRREIGPGQSYLAPSARCAGSVQIVESIVGDDARVSGAGVLRRVVALPGACLSAPLEDAIVTPSGRIVPCAARAL